MEKEVFFFFFYTKRREAALFGGIFMPMRRFGTLTIIVTMMVAACTAQDCPQCQLKKFYNQYLELNCPPQGEYPDTEAVRQLLKQQILVKCILKFGKMAPVLTHQIILMSVSQSEKILAKFCQQRVSKKTCKKLKITSKFDFLKCFSFYGTKVLLISIKKTTKKRCNFCVVTNLAKMLYFFLIISYNV